MQNLVCGASAGESDSDLKLGDRLIVLDVRLTLVVAVCQKLRGHLVQRETRYEARQVLSDCSQLHLSLVSLLVIHGKIRTL